jgi:nitrite reductase (NADH) small subunit
VTSVTQRKSELPTDLRFPFRTEGFHRCYTRKRAPNMGPLYFVPRGEGDLMSAQPATGEDWWPVCRLAELEVERGATALVHGQAIAVFRTRDDSVYALGNHDPFAHASGLARGIVGTRGAVPFVASPAHKHAFDLRTGRCLDDEHVAVPAYEVRVVEGVVLVGHRRSG